MSAEKSNQRGLSGDSESTVTQPEPSPLAGKGDTTGRTASTTSKAGSGMNGGKKPKGNKPIGHNVKDKGQPKPKADGNGGDSNAALCKRIDSLERIVTQMVELEQQRYDPPQHNTAVPAGDQPMDTAPDYFYDDPTGAGFEPDFIDHDRQSSSDFSSTSASAEALPVPAMAAKFMAPKDVGKPIDETIAQTANYLVKNQMEGKTLEDVSAKYPLPDNCQFIDTPKVNPPIWENLPSHTRSRDLKIQRAQKSLSKGLNAYLRTVSADTMSDTQQDALALLCNAQFELNCLRKDLIKPDLNSRYSHLCKPSTPVTRLLFGDNLSKQVKELKDQQLATAGVTKGQGGRRYHPYQYQNRAMSQQRQYRAAGWTSSSTAYRPFSGMTDRPFLGRTQGRGRPQPPGQSRRQQAPATQTRPSPNQGAIPKRK